MADELKVEPPRKGTVDALEHTMAELKVENIVGQSRATGDGRRVWTAVLVTEDAGVWTGDGGSMAESFRDALKKLNSYRKAL